MIKNIKKNKKYETIKIEHIGQLGISIIVVTTTPDWLYIIYARHGRRKRYRSQLFSVNIST